VIFLPSVIGRIKIGCVNTFNSMVVVIKIVGGKTDNVEKIGMRQVVFLTIVIHERNEGRAFFRGNGFGVFFHER
jgi:hypothetical protein